MRKYLAFIITAVTAMSLFATILTIAPPTADAIVPTSGLASCETGIPCTFSIGTISVTTTETDVIVDDPDGGRRVIGSPEIGGTIAFRESEMFFQPLGDDFEFIAGEARLPFPTTGFLADADVRSVPRAMFGLRPGSELGHLGAHVRADRDYFYFFFNSAFEIGLPWFEGPAAEVLPDSIKLDAGVSGTLVIDPSDPYIYVGSPCPELPIDNDKADSDKTDSGGAHNGGEGNNTGSTNGSNAGESGGAEAGNSNTGENTTEGTSDGTAGTTDEEASSAEESQQRRSDVVDALTSAFAASQADLSQDCGIGFSLLGNIPGPGGPGQEPISGHVVVDAKGTLPVGMNIDGTTVVRFDDGVRAVGYGKIAASAPIVEAFVDATFPLGDALIDLEISGDRIGYAVEGRLTTEETLPFEELPIALPGDGSVHIASSFAGIKTADGWEVDPDSFFEARGNVGVGPKAFGEAIGVELNNFATADAYIRVDRSAMVVQGEIGAEIHPSLETDAGLALDALLSFDAPETSYLAAAGAMRVAGTELGNASLQIDGTGFFVEGMLTNTVTTVEMVGQITAAGASLQGTGTLEVPLDGMGESAQSLVDDIDAAQADVDRLNHEIDDLTITLTAEREAATADLRAAQAAVGDAQRSVDSINATIASNNKKISYLSGRIKSEKRRYSRLSWYNKMRQAGTYSRRLASWNGAIAGLRTANAAQVSARTIAQGTLTAAKEVVRVTEDGLNLVPFDADPRMIALVAARETATLTLQTARAAAGPLADLHGTFRAQLTIRLATDGLAGNADAQWCTDSCVVLTGGRVDFTADGVAVCAVPAAGVTEVCGKL